MISNQILQNTIDGLKEITRIDLCVMDTDGKTLATTFSGQVSYEDAVMAFASSPADSQVIQGCQFFKIFDEHQLEYILLANGRKRRCVYGRQTCGIPDTESADRIQGAL